MKTKVVFLLLSIAMVFSLSAQTYREKEVSSMVLNVLREYPKAGLRDIYKSSFQEVMGVRHMMSDPKAVKKAIEKESQLATKGGPYYELCGINGDYIRVFLSAVADSVLSVEELASAFIRSAGQSADSPELESWKKDWEQRCRIISDMRLGLENFVRDSVFIDDLLKRGEYETSHSSTYKQSYNPHYRVIEREIFLREIFPKIIESEKKYKNLKK